MHHFTFLDIVWALIGAAKWTVLLSLIAFAGGTVVGLLILVLRVSGQRPLVEATRLYIEFFQGTPLLMQLFLSFFGLALFGIDVSPLSAAAVGLTLFASAYLAEIWRGAVEAIPHGQWEAARSLALGFGKQLRLVILPQALRLAIPPTVGFSVQIVKGTALASIIGFLEVTKAGSVITNVTFQPFTVYGLVAVIYFGLCFPLSAASKWLEKRLAIGRSH
ncbi:MAG: ABC-type amino acid transport system, permease component [Rhodospirillales bacterium]|nr:ABC-type amino acid transport system, permease component [Rhodospirillales bacterium]